MIDFRYHLVSLVSVFLALAVGIVLGAGPLKDPITEGLSQSVQQLRQDRDALGDQLKTAQAATRNRDTFIDDLQGQLVTGQLSGRAVVLVTLPGADADAVRPLTQALTDAGARVTGRIDVHDAWADPASRSARDTAIANLRAIGGGILATPGAGSSRSASPSPTASGTAGSAADTAAAEVLARALVTSEPSPGERPDATSRSLLEGLARAGLLDVNGETPARATHSVLLVPGVATAVDGVVPTPSPSPSPDETPAWVALASVLDAESTGAVVVGPASSATAGGLLAAVRAQQPLATTVSTVDTGSTPMGDVTTVLALREQQLGSAGSYGFGAGAKAVLPTRGTGGTGG
jgi:Copper transport outer membrane protein, MctB